jgi:hypothetical protein
VRYACCEDRRLLAVKDAGVLNGIEYVEVSDAEAPTPALRQRTLYVRLLRPDPGLTPEANVEIFGGERIRTVAASTPPPAEVPALLAGVEDPSTILLVRTDSTGDYSTYGLRLVADHAGESPPAGFDPLLASVEFSFKVECPSEFDCAPTCDCAPPSADAPAISYLAKDYDSFRRLMLDRLSLISPDWTERVPADAGVALVELLAYVADELSYRQDAIATEAYLDTARRRTSLRRHARLVDYRVREGANARTWVRIFVAGEGVAVPEGTVILTRAPDLPDVIVPGGPQHREALAAGAQTFETREPAVLYASHERLDFWTWGATGCCLPRGATSATLVGLHPALKAGEVLILAEVAGPQTGRPEDADPAKRAAVRLTSAVSSVDPSGGLFADPPTNASLAITEIAWDAADALPFALCLSVEEHPGLVIGEAWGNAVLADHGRTVTDEPLGEVPAPVLTAVAQESCDPCARPAPVPIPVAFQPVLANGPVTQGRPGPLAELARGDLTPGLTNDLATDTFTPEIHDWLLERGFEFSAGPAVIRGAGGAWSVSDGTTVAVLRAEGGTLIAYARPAAARATLALDPDASAPAVTVTAAGEPWTPEPDLLESGGDAPEFVVEVETGGTATLRFGDGVHGRRPDPGTSFTATYRVGNGVAGNVGAGALAHLASAAGGITRATNPMAAAGGVDPEAADAVRRDAPEAYRVQERAVTAADYASVSEREPGVERAAASFRWTGSWRTVFITADRSGGAPVDAKFRAQLESYLDGYRMAGYDLDVDGPRYVPLRVGLLVCVLSDYFRAHVQAAVLEVLSSTALPDGTLGLFHPDRFTFGGPVWLSPVVAATQAVEGVQSVTPLAFQRQRDDASSALDTGVLPMGRLEIAQLDDDPSFPERGVLELTLGGGK